MRRRLTKQLQLVSTHTKSSDSESSGFIASHALSALRSDEIFAWIVDSGGTCHMCHDEKSFSALYQIREPLNVILGDGHSLAASGRGKVVLKMVLPNGESKSCTSHDVLYVPRLAYNLISVTKASQTGKVVKFTKSGSYILDRKHKVVAKATKVGSFYLLDYIPNH